MFQLGESHESRAVQVLAYLGGSEEIVLSIVSSAVTELEGQVISESFKNFER